MAGALTHMIASIFSGSAVVPDEYFEYTTLLLPGNGTNGQTNNAFLDSSGNGLNPSRNGNTTQGTFSPFSQTGWSNYFDGASNFLNTPATGQFAPTGNFTIEGWFYLSSLATTQSLIGNYTGTFSTDWLLDVSTAGVLQVYLNGSSLRLSTSGITTNRWYYVNVSRSGSTVTGQINGSNFNTTATYTLAGTFGSATKSIYLGMRSGSSNAMTGYLSNWRLLSGSTSTSVPTSPLTAISGTSLLTCQSNRFIDNSASPNTITVSGNVSVQSFSPFNPTASWSAATNGGSGYFDGNTDYLQINSITTTDWYTATGNFTYEGWVYPLSFNGPLYSCPIFAFAADDLMLRAMPTTAASTTVNVYGIDSAGGAAFGGSGIGAGSLRLNEWSWVVFTRESGVLNVWINGTRVINNSVYTSTQLRTTGTNVRFGGANAGTNPFWNGYQSGIKWTSGAALYSGATISVPTAPPTPTVSSGTCRLLLNFTNAGIYDATSKNDLETVGSTAISTAQSQFGGSSILFSSSYLSYPVQPFTRIGVGDYTFECWVRPSNVSTLQTLLSFGSSALRVFLNSTNLWFLNSASTIFQPTNVFPTANVWYYVVIVRQGSATNNTAAFINGSRVVQATNTIDFNAGSPTIGGEGASNYLAGYMQDVRLTRYARYSPASSSITVPTAAFPTL